MTKEIVKVDDKKEENPAAESHFKGYSIEELRYQRALVALRKDFCMSKIINNANKLKKRSLFGKNGTTSRVTQVGGIASKIISGLGYLDYAMIGMSLFGTGRKIFRFFKRKK